MKILSLTTSYPRSENDEASIFVHRLNQALVEQGTKVSVLAPTDKPKSYLETRDFVTINWFRFLPFFQSRVIYGAGLLPNLKRAPHRIVELPFLVLRLAWLVLAHREKDTIVHANWILSGMAAWVARICGGPRYVVTLRGSDAMLFTSAPLRGLSYPILALSSAITTVSEELAAETKRRFPRFASKVSCIKNGVKLSDSSNESVPELPDKFIVAIGTVIPRKQLEVAIELLSAPSLSEYTLVICGRVQDPEYYSALRQKISSLALTQRVMFVGPVAPGVVPAILARASAFISSSSYEGRPNAVLEALLAGKVVACSDIVAHKELIMDGQNGILFASASAMAAGERLARILSKNSEVEALSRAATSSVFELEWSASARAYVTLFSTISDKSYTSRQ